MQLRPYQTDLITKIKTELRAGKRSVCAVLGCGGGKSVICADIAKSSTDKGNRVLFLVHRIELCEQVSGTFKAYGVNMSLCDVCMVQTATRRLTKIPEPQLIITDECQHSLSATYRKIYNYFPGSTRLGFTATPCRMNEGGLGAVYESLVESVSTKWLVENNYLAPFKYYSVKLADANNLHTSHGDYDSRELAALMEQRAIYGDTVSNYMNIANGKQAIVYLSSVEASKATAAAFIDHCIYAVHLDGTTPKDERESSIRKFRDGRIKILCNVDLLGEGLDVPDCECVILLRPTKSLTLYIQQSMRSMRYKPHKTAIIIDHVGNVFRHGFPDEAREWTLESKKRKQENSVHVKQCPECFACMPTLTRICPECGHEFTPEQCTIKTVIDTKLQEITERELLACKPFNYYKQIQTFDGMVKFQQAKKFKFGWTIHKCIEQNIPLPDKYDYMIRRFYN